MKTYSYLVPGAVKLWFNTPENPVPVVSIIDLVDVPELVELKTVGYPLTPKQARALSEKKSPAEQSE